MLRAPANDAKGIAGDVDVEMGIPMLAPEARGSTRLYMPPPRARMPIKEDRGGRTRWRWYE